MKYFLFLALLFAARLMAVDSVSVTYNTSTKVATPTNLIFVGPKTATVPASGTDIVNKTALDAAVVSGIASKLNTTNGVASGLTSSTLSSIAPGSVVARQYLDYIGSTNIDNWISMTAWGDSLTAGDGSSYGTNNYPGSLALYSGFRIANRGVSGQDSTQIRTRQTAASNTWFQPTLIWAGQNNFSSTNTVATDIAAMVANLDTAGNINRYLVISILGQTNYYRGTANYAIVTNLNGMLSSVYGQHFVDARSYLISRYNPANAQDVIDYNNDVVPSSLRADNQHLNNDGYRALGAYILTNGLATLRGSWSSVANPATVNTVLHQPGPIGDEVPNTVNATTLNANSFKVTNSPTVGNGTGNPIVYIDGGAGGVRGFDISTAGSDRWRVATSGSETGANAGANLSFQSFSDAGSALGYPLQLDRDGSVLLRAPASSSAATYFPVYITSPVTGNPVKIWSRTPSQVRSDIGADTMAIGSVTGLGTGVATLLAGASSGTGGPAGTTLPTFQTGATIGNGTGNPLLFLNGGSGGVRGLDIYTAGTARWRIATTGTESGSNLGASLLFQSYSDAGSTIAYPLQIDRTGAVTFGTASPVTVQNTFTLRGVSAPSTPASGYGVIYVNSGNGKVYYVNSAGTSYILTEPAVSSLTGLGTGLGTALGLTPTGSGVIVLATNAALTTPALGVATATSLVATSGVTGSVLTSTIATGTAPLTVASTTLVSNLNADRLDGLHKGGIQPANANLTNVAALTVQSLPSTIISVTENTQTGTTYTVASTDNGKVVTLNNASAITVTVPTLSAGFSCTFIQKGAGQVTFTTSGTTISNAHSQTKTFGQYAAVTLYGLSSTSFVLAGDTGS
jgi:lysophospholipase L1-like esterase